MNSDAATLAAERRIRVKGPLLVIAGVAAILIASWWRALRTPEFAQTLVETAQIGGEITELDLHPGDRVSVWYGADEVVLDVSDPERITDVEPGGRGSLYRPVSVVAVAPTAEPEDKVVVSGAYLIKREAGNWSVVDTSDGYSRQIGLPRSIRDVVDVEADDARVVIAKSDGRIIVLPPGELREDQALGVWYGSATANALAIEGPNLYIAAPIGVSSRTSVSRVGVADARPNGGFQLDARVRSLAATEGAVGAVGWVDAWSEYVYVLPSRKGDSAFWSQCLEGGVQVSVARAKGGSFPIAAAGCGSKLRVAEARSSIQRNAEERLQPQGDALYVEREQSPWTEIDLGPRSTINAVAQRGFMTYAAVSPRSGRRSLGGWSGVVAVYDNVIVDRVRTPALLCLVVDGQWLYGLSKDGRVVVLDATDPHDPHLVGSTRIARSDAGAGSRFSKQPSWWESGSPTLAVGGGQLMVVNDNYGDSPQAFVFDLSDPLRPLQITGSTSVCGADSAVAAQSENGVEFLVACRGRSVTVYRTAPWHDVPSTPTPTATATPRSHATPVAGLGRFSAADWTGRASGPPVGITEGLVHSSSVGLTLVTYRNCYYDLELELPDLQPWEEVVDLELTVRPTNGAALPSPTKFSARQLKAAERDVTPSISGDWPPGADAAAVAIPGSADATRLLVSGSASDGEYLVEGATFDTPMGVWYLLVGVPTECGSDLVAYVLTRG